MPRQVQHIADQILSRIPDDRRIRKEWAPRPEPGTTNHITSIEDAPLHEGNWLILARTNDKLIKLKSTLKDMAIYFEIKGRKSYRTRLYKSIQDFTRWTNGDKLSLSECKDLFEFLEEEAPTEERMYDLFEWGYSKTQRWFDVFKTDPEESLYTFDRDWETKINHTFFLLSVLLLLKIQINLCIQTKITCLR